MSLKPITIALTGASGLQYGLRLVECLLRAEHPVYLLISKAAYLVAQLEMGLSLAKNSKKLIHFISERYQTQPELLSVFSEEEWTAPIASGSGITEAMVICPCTAGCLAAIAHGLSDNLIERAADVILKERKKLILVPRETPYSTLHLKNMLSLSEMGAIILAPNPGFYHQPTTIEDLIDFVVARILDQLTIPHTLLQAWGKTAKEDFKNGSSTNT